MSEGREAGGWREGERGQIRTVKIHSQRNKVASKHHLPDLEDSREVVVSVCVSEESGSRQWT